MTNKNDYIPRLAELSLQRMLHSTGCVVVSGPKFCGKSTMCDQYASSKIELKTTNAIELAKSDPKAALVGTRPHLIDEWQKAPEIWNFIKSDLDDDYQFGKYIIAGSATPINPKAIQNSASGRIAPLMLRPFTLFESGESEGAISLSGLFEDGDLAFQTIFESNKSPGLADIAFYVCRGGWPIALKTQREYAIEVTKNYYNGLFTVENESDEFTEFLKNKDIELLKTIIKCFARNISTDAKTTSMVKYIKESGARSKLDEDTFLAYKKALKSIYIIYDMPAWNINLRSSVAVRVTPTHHFFDTSIATSSLGITPADLLNDLNSFGFLFEDMAVRDLSVYSECFGAKLKHYRDSSGQEVDAIVECENGEYAAIEIKIKSDENIKNGISSLVAFENKLIRSGLKLPKFKMILTSHGNCYKDKDSGVYIVPITLLRD